MEEDVVSVGVEDVVQVICPHCFSTVALYVDPTSVGSLVEDCEVCCRPWEIAVGRDEQGMPHLDVGRA